MFGLLIISIHHFLSLIDNEIASDLLTQNI